MRIKLFFLFCAFLLTTACQQDEAPKNFAHDVTRPAQSDRKPNGGLLRFTLNEKVMHDSFFEAQFTPRGEVFQNDNLQLYNYNLNSEKYPRLLISIDAKESDLENWEGKTFPLDAMAFTASAESQPLSSRGELHIDEVTDRRIEGTFSGELLHPDGERTFPIRGEFRAMLRVNI